MHARLGAVDGMRLHRAAFAVILKFSSHIDTFKEFMKEVAEVAEEVDEGKDMN